MAGVKKMFLLIIFQGFYLGSGGQRRTFRSEITALIGSCVEIPCTYDPDKTSSPVWHLNTQVEEPEILNTKDPSSVIEEYRGRTSLVPGYNSCALRIDPVRREDEGRYYYLGKAKPTHTDADHSQFGTVYLEVTDSPKNIDLYVPENISGEATIIRCRAEHTCGSSPPSLQWNKPGRVRNRSVQISGGSWRQESELKYIPSYVDDGSPVRCTATYPNGRKAEKTLNINYPATGVHITMRKRGDAVDLPLILWTASAVFFLLVILSMYIVCLRKISKTHSSRPNTHISGCQQSTQYYNEE